MAGMFAVLTPLHDELDEAARLATAMEAEFVENFGEELRKAWALCALYVTLWREPKKQKQKEFASGYLKQINI